MPYFDLQKQKKQPCTAQLKLLNISGFLFLTVLVSKQFTKNWFHNIKYHQSKKMAACSSSYAAHFTATCCSRFLYTNAANCRLFHSSLAMIHGLAYAKDTRYHLKITSRATLNSVAYHLK